MKIAVIGEKFIDRYFIGTSSRVSPEAPVPVVKIESTLDLPGGASNVAAGLSALEAEVVEIYPACHYPIKNRLMVGDYQLARWDQDDSVCAIDSKILKFYRVLLEKCDGIVISDYLKGAITSSTLDTLLSIAPISIPLFIDTKGVPPPIPSRTVFYFPNALEYASFKSSYDRLSNVVVTLGKDGSNLLHYGDKIHHIASYATQVASVNGAGDSVVAGFAYKYCQTKDPYLALKFAMQLASIAVSKSLTSTVALKEIDGFNKIFNQTSSLAS